MTNKNTLRDILEHMAAPNTVTGSQLAMLEGAVRTFLLANFEVNGPDPVIPWNTVGCDSSDFVERIKWVQKQKGSADAEAMGRMVAQHAEEKRKLLEDRDSWYKEAQRLKAIEAEANAAREQAEKSRKDRDEAHALNNKILIDVERLTKAKLTTVLASYRAPVGETIGGELCVAIPMLLWCPSCHTRHVDQGEFATLDKPHHTHACQHCGMVWRPALGPTIGVQFLPGFKDKKDE